ncbi:DUF6415 family natural product biosynthesis protein [Streptomyces sp. NPDC000410]|uniref:DUF6415 family natural product biosynthesis protein n=1 Tax=Streptomyces sp. NPDC000410 TaxID=3154254 RepID=UPI0033173D6A
MRNVARQALADDAKAAATDLVPAMRGFVSRLVPEVQELIRRAPLGDPPAKVAQVGVDEAWRRLHTAPGFGPDAACRHARKVALSVLSLCDHFESLTEGDS